MPPCRAGCELCRSASPRRAAGAGRTVDSITLLAVSKGQPAQVVREAAQLGVTHFAESYAAEGGSKIEALRGTELTWHFIGRLQANKTRDIAASFDWVHAVDRPARRATALRAATPTTPRRSTCACRSA